MSAPLEREVVVRCSVEHAFAVFSGRIDLWWPPGHRRFSGSRMELEGQVGGRFQERELAGEARVAVLGEVVAWEPPLRLAYTWNPGSSVGATLVEVCFCEEGASTRVEITHSPYTSAPEGRWSERVARFERAWGGVLAAFVCCVEPSPEP